MPAIFVTVIILQVFDISVRMFLRDNFVHGDLHAGV